MVQLMFLSFNSMKSFHLQESVCRIVLLQEIRKSRISILKADASTRIGVV